MKFLNTTPEILSLIEYRELFCDHLGKKFVGPGLYNYIDGISYYPVGDIDELEDFRVQTYYTNFRDMPFTKAVAPFTSLKIDTEDLAHVAQKKRYQVQRYRLFIDFFQEALDTKEEYLQDYKQRMEYIKTTKFSGGSQLNSLISFIDNTLNSFANVRALVAGNLSRLAILEDAIANGTSSPSQGLIPLTIPPLNFLIRSFLQQPTYLSIGKPVKVEIPHPEYDPEELTVLGDDAPTLTYHRSEFALYLFSVHRMGGATDFELNAFYNQWETFDEIRYSPTVAEIIRFPIEKLPQLLLAPITYPVEPMVHHASMPTLDNVGQTIGMSPAQLTFQANLDQLSSEALKSYKYDNIFYSHILREQAPATNYRTVTKAVGGLAPLLTTRISETNFLNRYNTFAANWTGQSASFLPGSYGHPNFPLQYLLYGTKTLFPETLLSNAEYHVANPGHLVARYYNEDEDDDGIEDETPTIAYRRGQKLVGLNPNLEYSSPQSSFPLEVDFSSGGSPYTRIFTLYRVDNLSYQVTIDDSLARWDYRGGRAYPEEPHRLQLDIVLDHTLELRHGEYEWKLYNTYEFTSEIGTTTVTYKAEYRLFFELGNFGFINNDTVSPFTPTRPLKPMGLPISTLLQIYLGGEKHTRTYDSNLPDFEASEEIVDTFLENTSFENSIVTNLSSLAFNQGGLSSSDNPSIFMDQAVLPLSLEVIEKADAIRFEVTINSPPVNATNLVFPSTDSFPFKVVPLKIEFKNSTPTSLI